MVTRAIALRLRNPAIERAGVVAFIVGGVGGALPGAFAVVEEGAGLGVGAAWGLWALLFASPMLVAYVCVAVASARFGWRMDRDLFLAGLGQGATLGADALATAAAGFLLIAPAALGGALSGGADAVARGDSLLTGFDTIALLACLGAALWWTTIVLPVASAARNGTSAYIVVVAAVALSLTAIQLATSQTPWDILSLTPGGAVTLLAEDLVSTRHGVETKPALVALGTLLWLLCAYALLRVAALRVPR